ncbi:MAG: hypothetical protein H7145_03145 [Akkermansiaceae bacterium]|nr:hypothetical protein [Armatimonadota bacterium]
MNKRKWSMAVVAVMAGVGGFSAGALCVSPATAQSGSDVASRLGMIERRLIRIESLVSGRNVNNLGRWQKIRDTGKTVVLMDNETGKVKFINTQNGGVVTKP